MDNRVLSYDNNSKHINLIKKIMPIQCSKYKVGLWTLKYMPILMALIMYIHSILLLCGINLPIARTIAGSAIIPSVLIFTMSSMLKFCYIHKSLTLYSLLVDLFINIDHYFHLGACSTFLLYVIVVMGSLLFCLLIYKIKAYSTKCCTVRKDLLVALRK